MVRMNNENLHKLLDIIPIMEYNIDRTYVDGEPMKYLSTFEIAEKWGLPARCVEILCNENRIPGAQRAE